MVMVFSILYTGIFYSTFPARFPLKANSTPAYITDSDNGMGGMPYFESPLEGAIAPGITITPASLTTGTLITGVPEPEEYSRPQILLYSSYKVRQGDTIGELALNFGLNQDTLISVNNIKNSRLLQIGQVLKVPNQDGILYTVKKGDTLSDIAAKHGTDARAIEMVNELFSDVLSLNASLFIPGAKLEWDSLQEINGELFIWPVSGYITSLYGYRPSPFTGVRQFHSGLDIGAPMGTPIKAAMAGRVTTVGYDAASFGNYVVITHYSGYRTLYGHMSVVRVKSGAYVTTGERIGDVGSTGLSTGPHLHFTVYKNGVTVNPRALMN
jgi:murein DD-endopeptidase MepM/ murein hydrolase activator NlpD